MPSVSPEAEELIKKNWQLGSADKKNGRVGVLKDLDIPAGQRVCVCVYVRVSEQN